TKHDSFRCAGRHKRAYARSARHDGASTHGHSSVRFDSLASARASRELEAFAGDRIDVGGGAGELPRKLRAGGRRARERLRGEDRRERREPLAVERGGERGGGSKRFALELDGDHATRVAPATREAAGGDERAA